MWIFLTAQFLFLYSSFIYVLLCFYYAFIGSQKLHWVYPFGELPINQLECSHKAKHFTLVDSIHRSILFIHDKEKNIKCSVLRIFCKCVCFTYTSQDWDNPSQVGVLIFLPPLGLSHSGGKKNSRCSVLWLICCVYNKFSSSTHTPPKIPKKSGRWEEAYIAFFAELFVMFCLSHFVARARASDRCIRRMTVQRSWLSLFCWSRYIRKGAAITFYVIWLHPCKLSWWDTFTGTREPSFSTSFTFL